MSEICEGNTKFLNAMKLVPLKDLGSIVRPTLFIKNIIIATLFTESTDAIYLGNTHSQACVCM